MSKSSLPKVVHPKAIPKMIKAKDFTAEKAWGALDIANMNGITTRLHWADEPYKWHINEGEEVFVMLDGVVDMHYKLDQEVVIKTLEVGDIFHATVGTEHIAYPQGEARMLVVESVGSE